MIASVDMLPGPVVIALPKREDLEKVRQDAVQWGIENGLVPPINVTVNVASFGGFSVQFAELGGRKRSAHGTYQRDGSRSLYELHFR